MEIKPIYAKEPNFIYASIYHGLQRISHFGAYDRCDSDFRTDFSIGVWKITYKTK
jgi:hypothetical protein